MKALLLLWVMGIAILGLPASAQDFDYSAYKDSSIAAAGSDLGIDPETTWWLDAAHAKFHTIATFTGKFRPVEPGTKSLIDKWAVAMGHDPELAAMFSSEIEVSQDGQLYWLPIQKILVEPLKSEVKPGHETHVYIILIGAYKLAPVFGVSEFNAAEG